jgi:hypothetical protein
MSTATWTWGDTDDGASPAELGVGTDNEFDPLVRPVIVIAGG